MFVSRMLYGLGSGNIPSMVELVVVVVFVALSVAEASMEEDSTDMRVIDLMIGLMSEIFVAFSVGRIFLEGSGDDEGEGAVTDLTSCNVNLCELGSAALDSSFL